MQPLLLSQFLRLLKSSYHKALRHLDSWIGDSLSDLVPSFGLCNEAQHIPDYFCHLESLVLVGRIDDLVTKEMGKRVTNRSLYRKHKILTLHV